VSPPDAGGRPAPRRRRRAVAGPAAAVAGFAVAVAVPLAALELPPPSPSERALQEVPGYPGAPAVVLVKKAELRLRDGDAARSTFEVAVRLKILTEAGKSFGQVVIGHSATVELEAFAGRTLLDDGSVVPLPPGAVFREEQGSRRVTKAALPAVAVGAMIEYRYRLAWDGGLFFEPWYLDDRVPTLYSELAYYERDSWRLEHRLRDAGRVRYRVTSQRDGGGRWVRIAAQDLPPVIEEPYGFPFADLALRVLIVPAQRPDGPDAASASVWRGLCEGIEAGAYAPVRRSVRRVRQRARRMVRGAGDRRRKIEILYRAVHDGLRAAPGSGLLPTPGITADRLLDAGRGTYADAALLLQSMLAAAGVPSRLVWAADWRDGLPDLAVPSPAWFDKVLLVVGETPAPLYLDPGDRSLAAGRLAPTQEGTEALICDGGPEIVTLPRTPAEGSVRRALVDLELDGDGRLHGRGRLRLTGHHAWFYLRRGETAEAIRDGWRRWLENALPGYAIAGVEVEERPAQQEIAVVWSMRQRAADVLGDEASVTPSRPLGPLAQRYVIPPERRRTPVRVSFADRDELELRLAWPPSWRLDLVPEPLSHATAAGRCEAGIDVDAAGRRLVYRRLLQIDGTIFYPGAAYAALRELYARMERHDAQSLVLVRD